MKISDGRKEIVRFGDIAVTDLLERLENEGSIYMKLLPVAIPNLSMCSTYNAVNVVSGRYAKFDDEDEVIPVRGSFHRERG